MLVLLEKLKLQNRIMDDERVIAEAIRFQYKNISAIMLGLLFFPAVTIGVLWQHVDQSQLLLWGGASYFIFVIRGLLARAYSRLNPPDHDAARWGNYFALTTLVAGITWGIAGVLFLVPDSTPHQVFILTVIIGLAAGSVITTSYWLPSFYAYAVSSVGIMIFNMFNQGTPIWISLGVLSCIFLLLVLRMGHASNKTFVDALRLRFENLELIEKLRDQKQHAEHANQAKTQFLASASHDLRQPVHALALFADALKYEVHSPKGQNIMLNLARSIESIDELLSSLLDISKLDAGVVKVNAADIRLKAILGKISNEFYNQANQKSLKFRVRDTALAVRSDPVLLANVIRNLIGNALRYTQHGGVLVGCRKRGDMAVIEIWDTGVGIPADEQKRIFQEFYQLNNPERDRGKGLGLGLAICQRLCDLLRHNLTLSSKPAQGSVFRIHVPLARSRPRDTLAPERERNSRLLDLEGKTILVIDDEKDILNAMRMILQAWQCQVLTAGSAAEAVQLLTAQSPVSQPDLLICDYRLRDGETGSQAIQTICQTLGRTLPAMIMTGDTAPERIREAQASGHTLLHKPVKPAQLYATLQELLAE
jgi:signal transduction histidine kinase/CheY-like chemotaxis protein